MQELNVQPSNPTPYTPAGGVYNNNPVPGAGGLPSLSGLNNRMNPMAQELQQQGRGEDSVLVHMTPNEVNSLRGLAQRFGGDLTTNPNTGLPEAGWLGKLLPTILGAIATPLTGGLINPLTASALIGAGTGIATGNLGKGLMAGLQAYGGAALGSAAGLNAGSFGIGQAANATSTAGALSNTANLGNTTLQGVPSVVQPAAPQVMNVSAFNPATAFSGPGPGLATTTSMLPSSITAATNAFPGLPAEIASTASGAATKAPGFFGKFAQAAKAGLPAGTPGIIAKNAPMLAGMGVLSGVSGAMAPSGYTTSSGMVDNSYQGPYTAQKRTPSFAADTSEILGSSKERRYFDVDMPEVYNMQGQIVQPGSSTAPGTMILQNYLLPTNKKTPRGSPMYGQRYVPYMQDPNAGYAKGGEIEMDDGAFVLDARTVSELGNGSSNAGKEILRGIGGLAIEGPGDGVSDSVPARIGKDQPARVARDEVIVPAAAVRRMGKGDAKRGADKLYALMDKAHKARKKAKRGQDTKLRKGLA
jgi:hypothetical protein